MLVSVSRVPPEYRETPSNPRIEAGQTKLWHLYALHQVLTDAAHHVENARGTLLDHAKRSVLRTADADFCERLIEQDALLRDDSDWMRTNTVILTQRIAALVEAIEQETNPTDMVDIQLG